MSSNQALHCSFDLNFINFDLTLKVPSAPADIKAISLDQHSVLVSWLPPTNANGEIVHYSVFMKTMENGRQFTQNYEVYPPNTAFSVRGLNQVRK